MSVNRKTYMAKTGEIKAKWWVIDAEGQVLGRLAVKIAAILQGKHRPTWTPHVDTGDFVILVNAQKVKLTGKKAEGKIYTRYTGYPSGLRSETMGSLLNRKPEQLIRNAVRRMMPKNHLAKMHMLKKLKIYRGAEHKHQAQQPVAYGK